MFLISPLIIWPMWMKPTVGLIWSGLLAVVSIIIPSVLTYTEQWPATVLTQGSTDPAESDYFTWNYVKPWCRFSPYIIGLILGYILHISKNKPIKLNKVSVAGIFILSKLHDVCIDCSALALGCSIFHWLCCGLWPGH